MNMRNTVTTICAAGALRAGLASGLAPGLASGLASGLACGLACAPGLGLAGCAASGESTSQAPSEIPGQVADQWRGKVVVADFWATWCGPCRASSPNIQALHDQFASDAGVLVVGVHADDNVENPRTYLDEHGYTYPVIEKGEAIAGAYGVYALPTFVVLDSQGREVLRHVGMMDQRARDKIAAKVAELRG